MAAYQATSTNSLSFEMTQNGQPVGKLLYKGWFKFNAAIELANHTRYEVAPKGFWGTTIELKEGERLLLKFNMNWNGQIVMHTYFNGPEIDYVFKHRGFFKQSFVLTDKDGTELLVMQPQLKWSKMNYEYRITSSDLFDTFSNRDVLLMSALHCANYYMSMMASASGV